MILQKNGGEHQREFDPDMVSREMDTSWVKDGGQLQLLCMQRRSVIQYLRASIVVL